MGNLFSANRINRIPHHNQFKFDFMETRYRSYVKFNELSKHMQNLYKKFTTKSDFEKKKADREKLLSIFDSMYNSPNIINIIDSDSSNIYGIDNSRDRYDNWMIQMIIGKLPDNVFTYLYAEIFRMPNSNEVEYIVLNFYCSLLESFKSNSDDQELFRNFEQSFEVEFRYKGKKKENNDILKVVAKGPGFTSEYYASEYNSQPEEEFTYAFYNINVQEFFGKLTEALKRAEQELDQVGEKDNSLMRIKVKNCVLPSKNTFIESLKEALKDCGYIPKW